MSLQFDAAGAAVERAERIAIVSHERPDGDAIGSLLGLSLALQAAGKHVSPALIGGLPKRYGFLPGAELVGQSLAPDCDLLILVDCAALDRIGFDVGALPRHPDINIDHHPTNTNFAAINLVDPQAAATTEILYQALTPWSLPLSTEVATNLLAGLLTDTIGFRTSSTRPYSLRMAADLLESGAPLMELYDRVISRVSLVAARYWGRGLARLEHEDGLVWSSLTLADRKAVSYPGDDDAELVNILMTIEQARVVVLFVEQPAGKVKISWRAEPGVDVSAVATRFGGGGHKPAAGAMLTGDLGEIEATVLAATREAMKQPA